MPICLCYRYVFFFSVFCLDAKFRFDDNAQFRQKELFQLRDITQEDPKEIEAAKFDLNYIALDGNFYIYISYSSVLPRKKLFTPQLYKLERSTLSYFRDMFVERNTTQRCRLLLEQQNKHN